MKLIHPILGSARINHKGYPRLNGGARRDQYLHRAVWEETAGRAVPEGFHIHHINGKLCWYPWQLIALEACLHQKPPPIRHPYTGRFMTADEYERAIGEPHYLAQNDCARAR